MRPTWHTRTRSAGLAVALVAVAATAAACGSSMGSGGTSSSPSTSASPVSSAAGMVKADWQEFFLGTTPAARKIALLQNGRQFAPTIQAQAASTLAKSTQAKVTAVHRTSATTAAVTYSILLAGQVALADQMGQAVLQGGTWKVSAASFSALLALEGAAGASPSASP
jgi:hypothetical protein